MTRGEEAGAGTMNEPTDWLPWTMKLFALLDALLFLRLWRAVVSPLLNTDLPWLMQAHLDGGGMAAV